MLPSRITTTSGVVNGIKDQNLAEDLKPHIYLAQGQDPQLRMYLGLRIAGDPAALSSTVRSKIRELDADVPVYAVRTMSDVVDKTLTSQKLSNLLLTAFATSALILAAIGIYGMMSVYVRAHAGVRYPAGRGCQTDKPSGFRMKQGFVLVIAGTAIGLFGAFVLTRTISSLLFNVSSTAPLVFLGVPLLLICAATWHATGRPAALRVPIH